MDFTFSWLAVYKGGFMIVPFVSPAELIWVVAGIRRSAKRFYWGF
jgi:hypothetical protein